MRHEITPETLEEFNKHYYSLHDALIEQTEIRIVAERNNQCDFEITLLAKDAAAEQSDRWTTLVLHLRNVKRFDLIKGRNYDFSVILHAGLALAKDHVYLGLFDDSQLLTSKDPFWNDPFRTWLSRSPGKQHTVVAEKCFWETIPHDYNKEQARLNIPHRVTDFDLITDDARCELSPDTLAAFKNIFGSMRKSRIRTITIGRRGRPTWGLNACVLIAVNESGTGFDPMQGTIMFEVQNMKRLDLTHWVRGSKILDVDEVNLAVFLGDSYLSFSGRMGPAAFEHPESFDAMSGSGSKKVLLVGEKCWWRTV